jgi:hypothetical protein
MTTKLRSKRLPPLNNPNEHDYQGRCEKNVHKPTDGIDTDDAEEPQYQKHDRDGIQHGYSGSTPAKRRRMRRISCKIVTLIPAMSIDTLCG